MKSNKNFNSSNDIQNQINKLIEKLENIGIKNKHGVLNQEIKKILEIDI
tara:strand:+ start:56463 stop:56609 length:147 start_codon:yes stop_codon:yes gene_type:complete